MTNIFEKYHLKETDNPGAYWYRYIPENTTDCLYGIDIKFINGHIIIFHIDEQGNRLSDSEPVQMSFEGSDELELLLKMLFWRNH